MHRCVQQAVYAQVGVKDLVSNRTYNDNNRKLFSNYHNKYSSFRKRKKYKNENEKKYSQSLCDEDHKVLTGYED